MQTFLQDIFQQIQLIKLSKKEEDTTDKGHETMNNNKTYLFQIYGGKLRFKQKKPICEIDHHYIL